MPCIPCATTDYCSVASVLFVLFTEWSEHDVVEKYLRPVGMEHLAKEFTENRINGAVLMALEVRVRGHAAFQNRPCWKCTHSIGPSLSTDMVCRCGCAIVFFMLLGRIKILSQHTLSQLAFCLGNQVSLVTHHSAVMPCCALPGVLTGTHSHIHTPCTCSHTCAHCTL